MNVVYELRKTARSLLAGGEVSCVIGYEVGPRGRSRPAFVHRADDAERLDWDNHCTHNLTTYLRGRLNNPDQRIAVVVKACDSRAINVLLAENRLRREQVYVIGMACEGILDQATGQLQARCQSCSDRTPVVYDTLIGEPGAVTAGAADGRDQRIAELDAMSPAERIEFWLSQFDRCIRCYACRQACPMCDCPTCLYERDDSLWLGMGTGIDEKRTFHLGRAYHLAGRCVGCDECERVCPMHLPISLLNRRLAQEVEARFQHRAGRQRTPSPITTILNREEA
jgi:ferredoxin